MIKSKAKQTIYKIHLTTCKNDIVAKSPSTMSIVTIATNKIDIFFFIFFHHLPYKPQILKIEIYFFRLAVNRIVIGSFISFKNHSTANVTRISAKPKTVSANNRYIKNRNHPTYMTNLINFLILFPLPTIC